MLRRVAMFMVFAVSLVIAFLVGNKLAPVKAQAPEYKFAAVPGEKGGQDHLGAYNYVPGWPKSMSTIPGHDPAWGWSAVESVYAQNPNKVFIVQRGELPVLPAKAPQVLIGPSLAFPVGQYPWRNDPPVWRHHS